MIWTYTTQDGSVLAGAKKTFYGEHPCNMCDSIKEAKKQEKKAPEILSATKKIELCAFEDANLLPAPISAPCQFPLPRNLSAESRPHSPVTPVPIA
jgi:hypothetical protein